MTPAKTVALLHMMEKQTKVVRVSAEMFYGLEAYAEAKNLLRAGIESSSEITVADYRTALDASRKYALALLEHFDQSGVTIRVGDVRKLRST